MKQTAIQELIEDLDKIKKRLSKKDEVLTIQLIINSAKAKLEMEKQQIIEAYIECKRQYVLQGNCYPPQFVVKEAEQYYNETFKKK